MMKLSYSKITTYLNCPLNFRFTYIDKLSQPVLPYHKLGNILHKTLKEYHRRKKERLPYLSEILSFYRREWGQITESQRKYFLDGREMLIRYYYQTKIEEESSFLLEERFQISINGVLISGRLDRADQLPDGSFEVIDYKTGREMPTKEELREDLQLGLYHLVFEKIVGISPKYLSFYFLRHGKKLTTKRDKDQLHRIIEIISKVAEDIGRGYFKPKEAKLCRYCGFTDCCPLKTEKPKRVETSSWQLQFNYTYR